MPEGIHAVAKEIENDTNKQYYSDSECNTSGHSRETEMEYSTVQKRNSIPNPSSNLQVCNVPLLQSDNVEQEKVDSQCIIVEAEVHNY